MVEQALHILNRVQQLCPPLCKVSESNLFSRFEMCVSFIIIACLLFGVIFRSIPEDAGDCCS